MATAKRTSFSESNSFVDVIPANQPKRYACAAHQCPMAGTLSGEGGHGVCAYHCATNPKDWGHISRTLIDWQCVTDEINACRRTHTNPETATDPGLIARLYAQAWVRLEPLIGTWEKDIRPQPDKSGSTEGYQAWGLRLECFLGGRVVEALRHQLGRKAA